jgi:hypothetical protein
MICLPATHTPFTKKKVGKKEEERKKKESHPNRYRDKSTNGVLLYYKGVWLASFLSRWQDSMVLDALLCT